jgi:hypothetical protein
MATFDITNGAEVASMVLSNDQLEAEINALMADRLAVAGAPTTLIQHGLFKKQTGQHCVCNKADDDRALWIGCKNKGKELTDRGTCRHRTGWFHPVCVGLSHLDDKSAIEEHPPWQCPCCSAPDPNTWRAYSGDPAVDRIAELAIATAEAKKKKEASKAKKKKKEEKKKKKKRPADDSSSSSED